MSENEKAGYKEYLGDTYNDETSEFDLNKAKKRALNEKEQCNIIICGATGVGKSTLINAIFGDGVVKAGDGEPITQHLEKIAIPEKGMCLWDTKGIEAKDYVGTMSSLREEFEGAIRNANNEKDIPHIGWVCIKASSGRVEDRDLELIGLLYNHNIPTVVVFTRVIGKTEREFAEKAKSIIDEKYKEFIDGAYVSVNSVPYEIDEDMRVGVKGLESLIDITFEKFPEGKKSARNAFIKAQKLKSERRLEAMKEGARKKVHIAAAAAGTAGASPIPFSSAPVISAIQLKMINEINAEFELDDDTSNLTSLMTGILGVTALSQVGRSVVSSALKFIPGAGSVIGGAISAATAAVITEAVGNSYIALLEKYYDMEKGKVFLPVEVGPVIEVFKTYYKARNPLRGSS